MRLGIPKSNGVCVCVFRTLEAQVFHQDFDQQETYQPVFFSCFVGLRGFRDWNTRTHLTVPVAHALPERDITENTSKHPKQANEKT